MNRADARASLDADVARIAAGDRAAMRRVYDTTSSKLFGICLRLAGDRDGAEEALQESYLKIWRRAASFDPARASAITWMCLIARGTAIDARRAAHRRDHRDHAPPAIGSGTIGEDARAIEDCLGVIDADQRVAIRSAFFDGYSYGELAVRFAVPLGTMKSRIRRGLQALRRCLDDD